MHKVELCGAKLQGTRLLNESTPHFCTKSRLVMSIKGRMMRDLRLIVPKLENFASVITLQIVCIYDTTSKEI